MAASIFDPTQYSNLREYVEAVQGSPLDYSNPQQQNILNAAVNAMYGNRDTSALQSFFPQSSQTGAGVQSTPAPLYTALTAQSTPQEIAAAYKEFTGTTGGDTEAARNTAANFLTNLGISAPTISQAYQQYTAPIGALTQATSTSQTPVDAIEQLYQQYAGRGSDPGGLEYWRNQFGSDVDANEKAIFQRAVAEGVSKGIESTATGSNFNPYFAANPDVAAEYLRNTQGMTPEQFAQTHYQKFGVNEGRAAPAGALSQAATSSTPSFVNPLNNLGAVDNSDLAKGLSGGDTAIPGVVNTRDQIRDQIVNVTGALGNKNWSGSWGGGGEGAYDAAANILANKGVTDLRNLVVEKNYEQGVAQGEFYNGQRVQGIDENEDGIIDRKVVYNPTTEQFDYLSADAKVTPGVVISDAFGEGMLRPLTEDELKTYNPTTGKFDLSAGNKLVDKTTGKTIATSDSNQFILDQYDTGNFLRGKEKFFGIQMTDDGIAVPYQSSQRSGMVVDIMSDPILGKVASAAAGYFGGPLAVGALNVAAGADFEDALKAAVLSYVAPKIGAEVSSATASALGVTGSQIAGNIASNFVRTGDLQKAFLYGGLGGGVDYVASQIPGFTDMPKMAQNALKDAVRAELSGQKVSDAVIQSAIESGMAAARTELTGTGGGITNRTYDDTITDAGADAFIKAKEVGADDDTALAAANAVTGTGSAVTGATTQPATTTKAPAGGFDLGEFAGVDRAVSEASARNTVVIRNDEADSPDEALSLARSKNPAATKFTFGGQEYSIGASSGQMAAATRDAQLAEIRNLPTFNDAFAQARQLLGPGQTFEWNGKQYSTATFAERPDLSGNVVPGAASTTAGAGRGSYAGYDAEADAASKAASTRATTGTKADLNLPTDATYDVMGNLIGGQTVMGAPDTSTLSGQIADKFAGAVNTFAGQIATMPSSAVRAGGNLLSNTGGIIDLVAGRSTEYGDKLRDLGSKVDTFANSIEDPNVRRQQAAIGKAIDDADGFLNKTAALGKAVLNNPLGATGWVFTEAFEEVPGVGLALKAGSKLGTYGIAIANDMIESGGAAYNDTYRAAIRNGMSEQEARTAARNSSLASMAATGVTQGVIEGKLLTKVAGKNVAGEGIEGGTQAATTQLALGQDLDANAIMKSALIEAAIGKPASTTAEVMTATNAAVQSTANTVSAAATSGDPAAVTGAITSSINKSLGEGANVNAVVISAVDSALTNGADLSSTVYATVGASLSEDASNAPQIAESILSSVIANNGDVNQAADFVMDALIDSGMSFEQASAISLNAAQAASNTVSSIASSASANTGVKTDIKTDASTGTTTKTSTDANTGITTETKTNSNTGVKTETKTDANTGTTTTTSADANTGVITEIKTNANTGVNTQTTINANTNITTTVTTNASTNVTTETKTDANTNTETKVTTDANTNTQTTVVVNTVTGEIIEEKVTSIPDDYVFPVIDVGTAGGVTSGTTTTAAQQAKVRTPRRAGAAGLAGGIGAMLPSSFEIDPALLPSRETQKAIDPLQRVMEAQAELENTAMMQQIDPRLLSVLQQRMAPDQQANQQQQFDKDIGALSRLLSGESDRAANEQGYYSYGSEDSIDSILGGKAANYKEGGYVAPLMAEGGMALPLLAKSGGALDHYNGRENFKDGKHVAGEGDGQSDDIPAWLADGEFVFPADVVSALGNGSTKAGTDKLYELMHNIRDRARSKGPKDLPPPALKSPLDYLKSRKRSQ